MSDKSGWSDNPEVASNTLICLTHQATYLLRRQLENLERRFLNEGGFTEKLYRSRIEQRSRGAVARDIRSSGDQR